MPTAESVFPKIGGDPLYYTEANRFAGGVTQVTVGSFPYRTTATLASVGSIVWGAGSLSNPCKIYIMGTILTVDAAQAGICQLSLSGLTGNGAMTMNGNQSLVGPLPFSAVFEIGSPGSSMGMSLFGVVGGDVVVKRSSVLFDNLYGGSPIVLDVQLNYGIAGGSIAVSPLRIFSIKHAPTGY